MLFIKEVDLTYIARVTKGFSGADLTEICQRVRNIPPSSEISIKHVPSHCIIIMLTYCIRKVRCIKLLMYKYCMCVVGLQVSH